MIVKSFSLRFSSVGSEFSREFSGHNDAIMTFISGLNRLNNEGNLDPLYRRRSFSVIYSLANLAVIQLHNVFADSDPNSFSLCTSAARKIVNVLDGVAPDDLLYLDPMIGVRQIILKVYILWT